MTLFEEKVYRLVRKIPKGKVSTYSSVACAIGHSRAVRAVGNALNKNPHAPKVPCHRVVRNDGTLGGFASGERAKKKLLWREGVEIKDGKINLAVFGWKK